MTGAVPPEPPNPPEPPTRPGPAPGGAGEGWAVIGTLFAGIVVWGGVGWLLDRWLGTRAFTPVGALVGVAGAIYLVVVKYGTQSTDGPPGTGDRHP